MSTPSATATNDFPAPSRSTVNAASARVTNAKIRNPEAVADAKAALAAERIALYVQKVLVDLPPLNEVQKERIGYMLTHGGAAGG